MTRYTTCTLAIILGIPILAQDAGRIVGTIRGPGQIPLDSVQVTIRDQASRAETVIFTDATGSYASGPLPPAYYTVEAVSGGLQTEIRRDLGVRAGSELRQDLVLSPASARWALPAPGTLEYLFLAALIPAIVTILFTEPGRKILHFVWAPAKWAGDKGYELLAPRFPKIIGLRGLRTRVLRSDLARIENPVSPAEVTVPLEQAYAPLALMSGGTQERIDLYRFAAQNRRFLVLGGPGTGKSTLMKNLV